MKGRYEQILRMKDNFTLAAIRCQDKNLKKRWKYLAKQAELQLQKVSEKPVSEIIK